MTTLTRHLSGVLERAGMLPPDAEALSAVEAVLEQAGAADDHVLEISRARVGSDYEQVRDVLIVLTRTSVVLVESRRRSMLGRPEQQLAVKRFSDYNDVAKTDDQPFGPSVFFLSGDERKVFALMWSNAAARDRMFMPIFWAHAGRFEHWGLMLNPADYVADFDRFYGEIVADAPSSVDGVREWIEQEYGEFDLANALGFAEEWRRCELCDQRNGGSSDRIMRLGFPYPWLETGSGAREILVRLGEPLFDAGAMRPPYDEITYSSDEDLTSLDAGPKRLIALMTLAGCASSIGHPRASEWVAAARSGIGSVPPSVFGPQVRELWSKFGGLPGAGLVEAPPFGGAAGRS